jgi:hypothetical protein
MGSLVPIVNDFVDIFLEAAKAAKNMKVFLFS